MNGALPSAPPGRRSSWRDRILREFTPQVPRLTLVADPDALLLEEAVLGEISNRGFELISLDDHLAFRFAYESLSRSRWDRGEPTNLGFILRVGSEDLSTLPHDLLQAGRTLNLSLAELFPNLSYPVVDALDRGDLDALYEAQTDLNPGRLGDNATMDFVLRHVFEIAPELVKKASDLLRVLLRRHYRRLRVPAILDRRLIQVLRQSAGFKDWPLEVILSDGVAFFAFLQERWPAYLDRLAAGETGSEMGSRAAYDLKYPGPLQVPFGHDDVRVYVDNLFAEGLLRPIRHADASRLGEPWIAAGIQLDPRADRERRLVRLVDALEASLPGTTARHEEWTSVAYLWAEISVLRNQGEERRSDLLASRLLALGEGLDKGFEAWLHERYAGLHNLPPVPPVMVHHVPHALARTIQAGEAERCCLVILDGLALDQWRVLRKSLVEQVQEIRFQESAVFAWVPTVTPVSRQAILAGQPPLYFPDSIHTTDKEPSLWARFWGEKGLAPGKVGYLRGLGDGPLGDVRSVLCDAALAVAALVVDKVDRIMHGMELGSRGMLNQVDQWAAEGYMAHLLTELKREGFRTYITSDHGNIEARGCGRPAEGAVVEEKGQRARVYPSESLRGRTHGSYPESVPWPQVGLPDEYFVLLAPKRTSFAPANRRTVSHGGTSIEEMIVPFAEVLWEG